MGYDSVSRRGGMRIARGSRSHALALACQAIDAWSDPLTVTFCNSVGISPHVLPFVTVTILDYKSRKCNGGNDLGGFLTRLKPFGINAHRRSVDAYRVA